MQDELARGNVVIVAGYQGVSYKKDVTTLGRGGSDTTAVALAAALDAEGCEIYSDVAGVYSADPRIVPDAVRLSELSYDEMQELARCGARVLNSQAVEFAKDRGIALYARAASGEGGETVVRRLSSRGMAVVGVAGETGLVLLTTSGAGEGLAALLDALARHNVLTKEILSIPVGDDVLGAVLLSLENVHDFPAWRRALADDTRGAVAVREGLGAVSVVGADLGESPLSLERALLALAAEGIHVIGFSASGSRLRLVVDDADTAQAARILHRAFVEPAPPALS